MTIDRAVLTDLQALTLTIFGEARGERRECQFAVGNVIANRLRSRSLQFGGDTWKAVCLAPKQFSCWNEKDPNLAVLERAIALNLGPHEGRILKQCRAIADGWVQKLWLDEIDGANHYYTGSRVPHWAQGQEPTRVIGPLKLFKL